MGLIEIKKIAAMIDNLVLRISQLNNFYIVSLLFIFVIFCYGVTLGNGLFFDDEQFIYNNVAVKNFDLPHLLTKSLSSESGEISNYYRPLLFIGFSFEYQLFKDSSFIYHFDSLFLHFLGGVLLFLLIKKLFSDQLLAFSTALLFLIHPIQTEAIAYASGRGDPLSFFFIMLTLLFLLNKGKKYHIISFITLIAALFSKEIALMTPGLIFIVLLSQKKSFTKKSILTSLIQTLPYALITISYFILRITVLNFNNTLNFYNSENIYSSHLQVRLATFFHIFPQYLELIFYPKKLFMERDSVIKVMTTITLPIILSILGIITSFFVSIWKRKNYPIIFFSLLWIGITFVPTSGILPINGIFYEHFLFFPSVGFFLLISYVFISIYRRSKSMTKEILGILFIIIVSLLCFRTIARNLEWHDPITFYNQTLNNAQSSRIFNNLAMAYADSGRPSEAINTYLKAIKIGDSYPETHYNLGNSYTSIGDARNAEKEYRKSLEISPAFYLSYIKLYSIYKSKNDKNGLAFIHTNLTNIGKSNPQFLTLLRQLENN